MSSEIRAGDSRTYWIISNSNSYVDGVTDPNLVTTVGTGWYLHWIGTDYQQYVNECSNVSIIPRNSENTATNNGFVNDKISARQVRLWLITNGYSLDSVVAAINSIEDPVLREKTLVEWEYAPYIERNHPLIPSLSQALGLTDADIDRAFREGYAI